MNDVQKRSKEELEQGILFLQTDISHYGGLIGWIDRGYFTSLTEIKIYFEDHLDYCRKELAYLKELQCNNMGVHAVDKVNQSVDNE